MMKIKGSRMESRRGQPLWLGGLRHARVRFGRAGLAGEGRTITGTGETDACNGVVAGIQDNRDDRTVQPAALGLSPAAAMGYQTAHTWAT